MNSELILATSPHDADIAIWDAKTYHPLPSRFKLNGSKSHGVCQIGTGYIGACQTSAAKLKIWSWRKGVSCVENDLPEKCLSLASTSDGLLLFAGGKSGRIHTWELSTGRLLKSWQAHYKSVTVLKTDVTGNILVSSSEDASIHLWFVPEVLDTPMHTSCTPFRSWSIHTLPVTDLQVLSCSNELMILSVSMDCSCRLWSIVANQSLKTLILPCPVFSIVVDKGQCSVFCGGSNGCIYESSLVEIAKDGREYSAFNHSHHTSVTSLQISSVSERLFSGSLDCMVKVWDLLSKQCLITLEFPGKRPISGILIAHCPSIDTPEKESEHPILTISNLQKFPNEEKQSLEKIPIVLNGQVQYKGISHHVLKSSIPHGGHMNSGAEPMEHKAQKLNLDVSEDSSTEARGGQQELDSDHRTIQSLLQQILEQD